ncbi:MAG: methyltransferase domain-containing protein [Aggregatilineales bacterium]
MTLETMTEFMETADIETSSDGYAARFAGKVGAWFLEVQRSATLDMLAPYPGATILDLGGGHGQLTEALIWRRYDVTVGGSAEICKARIASFVDRKLCNFEVVDFLNLPYADRSFGIVISYRLLPHVTQWERFIAEMARVAEKGILIDYPEKHSVNYFTPNLFRLKKQLEGNTRPYRVFTQAELLSVFQQHNFALSECYPEFFLPMVLHRKLKLPQISAALEDVSRRLRLTKHFGSPVIMKLLRQQSDLG